MLLAPALAFVNHLLASEDWARARLRPFAGQQARFVAGPFDAVVTINGDGSLSPAAASGEPAVSVRLPDDTPFRLLADRDSIFAAAHISGAADLAEALGFVVRNLRWDAEADLAGVVGDLAAHRAAILLRQFVDRRRMAMQRLGANLSEFVVDEEALVVRPQALRTLGADIDRLSAELDRLEARVNQLR